MLESKTESTDTKPQKKDSHDSNLLDDHIASELYERKRNWYIPSDPMGIKYFEKTWYISKYGKMPFYIHITLPIYILSTLIYSLCHTQPHYWFALILLLLIFQLIAILLQVFISLYIANKFDAKIHRIVLWPYGSIGYASDFKQWSHFFLVEYAAPLFHIVLFVFFIGIAAIAGISSWDYRYPINTYFGTNLLNGIWIINIIIASLHICIPVYPMKTARFMVNYLYRKRTHREVAQLIMLPCGSMFVILLIVGIVDARPLPLFLSLWTIYQTYLLWDGNRKNLVAKLPLFQLLENSLRHRRGRKKKSLDVGQRNRNEILKDLDIDTQQNTQQNIVAADNNKKKGGKRKKMSTLDEDEEYEPNIRGKNKAIEVIEEKEMVNGNDKSPAIIPSKSDDSVSVEKGNQDKKEEDLLKMEDKTETENLLNINDDDNNTQTMDDNDDIKTGKNEEEDLLNINVTQNVEDKMIKTDEPMITINDEQYTPNQGNDDNDNMEDDDEDDDDDNNNDNDNDMLSAPVMISPQVTGDSEVMVNGVSTDDPEYEIVDMNTKQQSSNDSDKPLGSDNDFVDVANE